jgi:hypothetical protein
MQAVASALAIPALCASLLLTPSASASAGASPVSSASDAHTRAPVPTVIRSTGAIEGDIDLFRALLGGSNNGATPGQQASGRREINWDGVPANVTNVPDFPNAFFNTNSPRGLVYETQGTGLMVSDQSFANVNPEYDGEFIPFSGHKTFSPIGTNATDIVFFVAGSNTKAAVNGIGVVFLDVDRIGQTSIELLGQNGLKLGRFTAPIRSDRRGASFLGIVFRNPLITHVHIGTGDGRLAANEVDIKQGGQHDLVVMDDLIYGEPKAIAP